MYQELPTIVGKRSESAWRTDGCQEPIRRLVGRRTSETRVERGKEPDDGFNKYSFRHCNPNLLSLNEEGRIHLIRPRGISQNDTRNGNAIIFDESKPRPRYECFVNSLPRSR